MIPEFAEQPTIWKYLFIATKNLEYSNKSHDLSWSVCKVLHIFSWYPYPAQQDYSCTFYFSGAERKWLLMTTESEFGIGGKSELGKTRFTAQSLSHYTKTPLLMTTLFSHYLYRQRPRPSYNLTSWHYMSNILYSESRILVFCVHANDTITQSIHW